MPLLLGAKVKKSLHTQTKTHHVCPGSVHFQGESDISQLLCVLRVLGTPSQGQVCAKYIATQKAVCCDLSNAISELFHSKRMLF